MKKILTALSILFSSLAIGQTACDSLDIEVYYYPFSDSLIEVHVVNNNTVTFFGYPQFTVLDNNNDTVAHELVNFFGLSQEQTRALDAYPGMPAANTFPGTLILNFMPMGQDSMCSWNMNFDLCPDTCQPFYPHFENTGGQQVLGTASWEILNTNQQVVANGSFVLDVNNQAAADTVCLDPGNYTYKVTNVNMNAGGQKWTGLWSNNMYVASPQVAFNDPVETITLELYEACQQTTKTKMAIKNRPSVNIYSYEDNIHISNLTGEAIGEVRICSADGRTVRKEFISNRQHTINMASYPYGVHIVKVVNEGQATVKKVFVGK